MTLFFKEMDGSVPANDQQNQVIDSFELDVEGQPETIEIVSANHQQSSMIDSFDIVVEHQPEMNEIVPANDQHNQVIDSFKLDVEDQSRSLRKRQRKVQASDGSIPMKRSRKISKRNIESVDTPYRKTQIIPALPLKLSKYRIPKRKEQEMTNTALMTLGSVSKVFGQVVCYFVS